MASPVHPYSDYGVALRTLKSARGWLGYLMLACVIMQFVGFGLMYATQQPYWGPKPQYTKTNVDELKERMLPALEAWGVLPPGSRDRAAEDWFPRSAQARQLNIREQWEATYTLSVPVTQVLGLVAATSQAIIVFLTLLVILMAHAPGVAQVTRSLIWTVLLAFMVFPWQFVFTQGFPIPGIFWGYREMLAFIGPHVVGEHVYGYQRFLLIARFVLWPLLSLLVLLISSERFRSGVMLAIGHPLQSMMQPPSGSGVKGPSGAGTPGAGGSPGVGYGMAAKR